MGVGGSGDGENGKAGGDSKKEKGGVAANLKKVKG